jgi:hypothetical protein
MKPLSLFGVVHYFQQRRLCENLQRDFPAMVSVNESGTTPPGVAAFLQKYFIDTVLVKWPETESGQTNGNQRSFNDIELQVLIGIPERMKLKYLRGLHLNCTDRIYTIVWTQKENRSKQQ